MPWLAALSLWLRMLTLTAHACKGGHSTKRTHSNAAGPNIGNVIISQLAKAVQDMPQITVITSAQVRCITPNHALLLTPCLP